MTLIVTQVSRRFVVHVGDRLVSRSDPRLGPIPFDVFANKSLVYAAPDAIVALGYTGAAYLDSVTTDQWIAETLIGRQYPRSERPSAMSIGRSTPWLPIGPALDHVAEALTQLWPSLPSDVRGKLFEILGSGWQWNRRGRTRPVIFGIARDAGASAFTVWRARRHVGRGCDTWAVPESNASLLDLPALRPLSSTHYLGDDAERLMVNAIRSVSAQIPDIVGTHCMGILLPPPHLKMARISYVPAADIHPVLQDNTQARTIPVAFSPWVIGESMTCAPSVIAGRHTVHLGGFAISLMAPLTPPHDIRGLFLSQRRPRLR